MGKVIAQASMSLDGFIADANDQAGPLFDWYNNGDVEITGADPASGVFRTSQASADYLRAAWPAIRICSVTVTKWTRWSSQRVAGFPSVAAPQSAADYEQVDFQLKIFNVGGYGGWCQSPSGAMPGS